MEVKKISGTYNEYNLKLSYGAMVAIYHALAENHADVVRDETFKTLGWYLENLAPPGMDEEEFKKTRQAEKDAEKEAETAEERDLSGLGKETEFGAEEKSSGEKPKPAKKESDEADNYLKEPPAD